MIIYHKDYKKKNKREEFMNKKKLSSWLNIIGLIIAVVSVFVMFLPAMRVTVIGSNVEQGLYNAFQTMFGAEEANVNGVYVHVMEFSIMNFIGGLLILLGIAVMVINVTKPMLGGAKIAVVRKLVAGALLVAGGILAFFTVEFVVTNGFQWPLLNKSICEGPIIQGIIAILSGLCVITSVIIDKLNVSTPVKIEK